LGFACPPACQVSWLPHWDIVTMLCLVFTALVTPVEVAFLETNLNLLFALNRVVDLIFIMVCARNWGNLRQACCHRLWGPWASPAAPSHASTFLGALWVSQICLDGVGREGGTESRGKRALPSPAVTAGTVANEPTSTHSLLVLAVAAPFPLPPAPVQDFIFNMFTARFNEQQGRWAYKPKDMFMMYFRGWFFVDLVSAPGRTAFAEGLLPPPTPSTPTPPPPCWRMFAPLVTHFAPTLRAPFGRAGSASCQR
jgi:hypothetical protein